MALLYRKWRVKIVYPDENETRQQSISELDEFKEYASEADIRYGIDRTLNWMLVAITIEL